MQVGKLYGWVPLITALDLHPAYRAPQGARMDSLEYEVLSYLEAGRSMFRPRELSHEAQQSFGEVLGLMLRLRRQGHVEFADSRISRTEPGTYLALGPVDLTDAGRAALAQERRRGLRSGRSYDRLWRLD